MVELSTGSGVFILIPITSEFCGGESITNCKRQCPIGLFIFKGRAASCCVLISKDALPDLLTEFVREVKKNDGSTQDLEVSNFAMTWRNEEAKGEVVWQRC